MSQPAASALHPRPKTTYPSLPPQRSWLLSVGRKRGVRRRLRGLVKNILAALQTMLELADKASDDAGVPYLKVGLRALTEIIRKIQTMKANIEGVEELNNRIATLSNKHLIFYTRPNGGQLLSDDMRLRIETLTRTWSNIARRAQDIKSRSAIKRFFTGDADAKKLEKLVQEINNSIQEDIIVGGVLNIEVLMTNVQCQVADAREEVGAVHQAVDVVSRDVNEVGLAVDAMNEGVNAVGKDVGAIRQAVVDIQKNTEAITAKLEDTFMPVYAKNAQSDAGSTNEWEHCLERTHVDALERLLNWVTLAISYKDYLSATNPGNVYWICSPVSTGRAAIAYSVAHRCREKKILGASFFCSSFDDQCNDPTMIFLTISHQLCHFHAPFKDKVAAILKENPTIIDADAARQFQELILRPLEELKGAFPLSVIVLDALDECSSPNATSIILPIIAKYASRLEGLLLFVITGRLEREIAALFEKTAENTLKDRTTLPLLHMIELKGASVEIWKFLSHGFQDICTTFGLVNWPAPQIVEQLAERSNGLCIWAGTVLRFIADENISDPQKQLDALMGKQPTSHSSNAILHSLYNQIAEAVFSGAAAPLAECVRRILGALVLAEEPLSVAALASLVGIDSSSARAALIKLHSVLHLPEDDTAPIRIIHPTFAKFLLDSTVPKPMTFRVVLHKARL